MPAGSFSAKIDSSNLKKKLDAAEPKIRSNISNQLNRLGTMTTSNMRASAPRDTSNMVNQMRASTASPNHLEVIITAGAKYTRAVDEGTKPHFPPFEALIPWAKRHPMAGVSPESSAFLIARAISKRGSKARNFIKPVITPAKAEAIAFMKDALRGVF